MSSASNAGKNRYQTDHPPALTRVAVHNSTKHREATDRVDSTRREESTRHHKSTKRGDTTTRAPSIRHGDSSSRHDSTRRGDSTPRQESKGRSGSTRVPESTRYEESSHRHGTSKRGDSTRYPDSRVDSAALSRTNTRQSLAPGMTNRLESARHELALGNPSRDIAPPSRHGSTMQRSGSRSMQPQYGPPPQQYGPDPYGGDTVQGRCEAIGIAALGVAQGVKEGIAAYERGGLPATGVVAAKTVIQTRNKLDARFPNGLP